MRLSDEELASRVRAGNRQRAQRQHERRRSAGLVAVTVWLNASTKAALFAAAQSSGETASESAERLLSAALEAPSAASVASGGAEPALNSKPARIALQVASTGMSEPAAVRVFADLPEADQAALVAVMQDWKKQRKSLREISAAMFEQHGVGTASGKPLWPAQVKKILGG